ncbi:hypothetical protein GCM10011579_084000 [Streptomyces albiflavescens]|uniref:HTH merR-type domain-containing protein n=1 Tax=Streptomyces albiflavescens TaxID=1623582 RepID=A0A918DA18_9ACTN|nr:MerR family DNA-binding transcriptional regulator [Streptomyces albiflavescens]GGN89295.1 hypothetical protein GCM10011579_084000 [Streptomyces albiflavescens]
MRTGELAAASGLTAKTIRFYEQAGLLPEPPRTSGGYRDYPPQATQRLAFIREAQAAGLTSPRSAPSWPCAIPAKRPAPTSRT